jgi:hypothetical protein
MSPLVPYTRQGENFSFKQEPEPKGGEQSLLYSVEREIRLHNHRDNSEYLIVTRHNMVNTLAYHEGILIDAGGDGVIRKTLSRRKIAERVWGVFALASHKGVLYDAVGDGVIRKTFSGKVIGERPNSVFYFASYNNVLIEARRDGVIRKTFSGEEIATRSGQVTALAVYNGLLIDACYGSKNSIIRETSSGDEIAKRPGVVYALASYNDVLIDAGGEGVIHETLSDKPIVTVQDKSIISLLPLSQQIADQLLARKEVRKLE